MVEVSSGRGVGTSSVMTRIFCSVVEVLEKQVCDTYFLFFSPLFSFEARRTSSNKPTQSIEWVWLPWQKRNDRHASASRERRSPVSAAQGGGGQCAQSKRRFCCCACSQVFYSSPQLRSPAGERACFIPPSHLILAASDFSETKSAFLSLTTMNLQCERTRYGAAKRR